MYYTLTFVLRYRSAGKVKTVKTLLYDGCDYGALLRIQDRNVIAGLHSVSTKKMDDTLHVTILENNVD